MVMELVKEKVKCRDCGKEGEMESTLSQTGQDFRIHFDDEGKEYFLCLTCEPKKNYQDRDELDYFFGESPSW